MAIRYPRTASGGRGRATIGGRWATGWANGRSKPGEPRSAWPRPRCGRRESSKIRLPRSYVQAGRIGRQSSAWRHESPLKPLSYLPSWLGGGVRVSPMLEALESFAALTSSRWRARATKGSAWLPRLGLIRATACSNIRQLAYAEMALRPRPLRNFELASPFQDNACSRRPEEQMDLRRARTPSVELRQDAWGRGSSVPCGTCGRQRRWRHKARLNGWNHRGLPAQRW